MGKLEKIYDSNDLTHYSDDTKKRIDKAVVAAAFRIRDNIRKVFLTGSSLYKYHTSEYSKLAEGILVGRLNNSKVKVHAMGSRDNYNSYKTRFFVGGTIPRVQTKQGGRSIKPYTKGYIRANNAVDTGTNGGENILDTYIRNVLEK